MMIYFAGSGRHLETSEFTEQLYGWGVLLSYNDMKQIKDNKGNGRFKKIVEVKKGDGDEEVKKVEKE